MPQGLGRAYREVDRPALSGDGGGRVKELFEPKARVEIEATAVVPALKPTRLHSVSPRASRTGVHVPRTSPSSSGSASTAGSQVAIAGKEDQHQDHQAHRDVGHRRQIDLRSS